MASLRVRLTPSGGADRIDGIGRDANGALFLKARVRAAPEKGEANAALEALLAKSLKLPKSRVTVARGTASRLKTVECQGAAETAIAALFAQFSETS